MHYVCYFGDSEFEMNLEDVPCYVFIDLQSLLLVMGLGLSCSEGDVLKSPISVCVCFSLYFL